MKKRFRDGSSAKMVWRAPASLGVPALPRSATARDRTQHAPCLALPRAFPRALSARHPRRTTRHCTAQLTPLSHAHAKSTHCCTLPHVQHHHAHHPPPAPHALHSQQAHESTAAPHSTPQHSQSPYTHTSSHFPQSPLRREGPGLNRRAAGGNPPACLAANHSH